MAFYPSGNPFYPSYASYPGAYQARPPVSPKPWPVARPMNTAFARPLPIYSPPAVAPTPATPQPWMTRVTNHLPSLPTGMMSPAQPMTITLNTPKMSKEEIKKSFWLKFAATTASFVAGMGIVGYVGWKLWPKRIANEMGAQTMKALLNSLSSDKHAIHDVLHEIKNSAEQTTFEEDAREHLFQHWGRTNADALFKNKKDLKRFLSEIEPHIPLSKLAGLVGQQITRAIFTPKFCNEMTIHHIQLPQKVELIINEIKKHIISNADRAKLVEAALRLDPKNQTLSHLLKEQSFKELSPALQDQALEAAAKVVPLSESVALFGKESLTSSVLEPEAYAAAQKIPNVKAAIEAAQKSNPELSDDGIREIVMQNISLKDTLGLIDLPQSFYDEQGTKLRKAVFAQIPGVNWWFSH